MSAKYRALTLSWLPLAFVISISCAAAYGAGQQVLRQSANDPQIQLAEDAATRLSQGAAPDSLVGDTVNVAQSLAPAIMIYSHDGRLLASSLEIDGQTPKYPAGALSYAASHGKDTVTWQTNEVRLAAAAVSTGNRDGDIVVAARSLSEVEVREARLAQMVLAGWLLALGSSLALQWWLKKLA